MKILIILIAVHIICSIIAKRYVKIIFSIYEKDFESKGISQEKLKYYGNLFSHLPILNMILSFFMLFFMLFFIIGYIIRMIK